MDTQQKKNAHTYRQSAVAIPVNGDVEGRDGWSSIRLTRSSIRTLGETESFGLLLGAADEEKNIYRSPLPPFP